MASKCKRTVLTIETKSELLEKLENDRSTTKLTKAHNGKSTLALKRENYLQGAQLKIQRC